MKNNRAKAAYETMANRKMNCAQAVLTSFYEELGLDKKVALSIAQGFGGGMGHSGGTCGAVTGACMAMGLAQKFTADNPRQNVDKTYALINEFNRKFKEIHASLNCTELTGFDLGIPEQLAEAREKGVFLTKCPNFVGDSVQIVENLLNLK